MVSLLESRASFVKSQKNREIISCPILTRYPDHNLPH